MDSITNLDHMEFLWRGELPEREKFIVRARDGRNFKPLFDSGVYFLWNRDGLQYIGQSWFVWERLKQHHVITKKDFDEWLIGVIPIERAGERLRVETYCIRTFRPPKNIMNKPH